MRLSRQGVAAVCRVVVVMLAGWLALFGLAI
jgi:hypothetical protein